MAASPGAKGAALESAAEAAARTLGIEGLRVFMMGGVPHIEGTVPSFQRKRAAAEIIGVSTGAEPNGRGAQPGAGIVTAVGILVWP